jgi:predicted O-methyltransferase YrrM
VTDVDRYRRMTDEIAATLQSQGFSWTEGTSSPEQLAWLADLVRHTKARRIAEVGFHAGYSSHAFLDATSDARVVSFDLGQHPHLDAAKRLVDERFPQRHLLVRGDSRVTVPAYADANPDARFDIIFIDGGHWYDVARADLANLRALAAQTATVVMDDLTPWEFWGEGPTRAWADAVRDGLILPVDVWQDGRKVEQPSPPARRAWARGVYRESNSRLKAGATGFEEKARGV